MKSVNGEGRAPPPDVRRNVLDRPSRCALASATEIRWTISNTRSPCQKSIRISPSFIRDALQGRPSNGAGLDVWSARPHSVPMASDRAKEAASRGALVTRAGELGTVAVTGRDRQSWLNGLVTSDLTKLAPGIASYGLALVKVGRIISDLWVVPAGERLLVGVPRHRI